MTAPSRCHTLPGALGDLAAGTLLLASVVSGAGEYYVEQQQRDPNWLLDNDGDRRDEDECFRRRPTFEHLGRQVDGSAEVQCHLVVERPVRIPSGGEVTLLGCAGIVGQALQAAETRGVWATSDGVSDTPREAGGGSLVDAVTSNLISQVDTRSQSCRQRSS